jgi:PAS domain S-box-containing protein
VGIRIAVDAGSTNHLLLSGLPESRRPALTVVATREDQIRAFERGEVDGAAGNHLTMRFLMGALAENAVEVPLISRPYHLAVLPGREHVVAPLRVALDRLKNSGEFDRLVEQYLSTPVRQTWLERYATSLTLGGASSCCSSLAEQRGLDHYTASESADESRRADRAALSRRGRQCQRHDLPDRSLRPVHLRQSGRHAHPRLHEGELLSMKYFELMRPDWVPRAMGFYEKAARASESTYLEFPVRKKMARKSGSASTCVRSSPADASRASRHGSRHHRSRQRPIGSARERDFVSAILNTAPSLIMVLDSQGQIVRFNRACEELSGVSMADVAGRAFWEVPFILEDDRLEIRDNLPRLLASTEPVKIDQIWVGSNGARRTIAWTITAPARVNWRHVVLDRNRRRRHDRPPAVAAEVAIHEGRDHDAHKGP